MVYPSCLVLLPLTDIPAVVPQGSANTSGSMCGAQQGQAAHRDPAISSITLTPPTSPEEAQAGKIQSRQISPVSAQGSAPKHLIFLSRLPACSEVAQVVVHV